MSEGIQHIDDYFKSSLENFEAHPPKDVWALIEEDLNVSGKKQRFIVFYRVAAAITFLAILGTGYLYYRNINKSEIAKNESHETENVINNNQIIDNQTEIDASENTIITQPDHAEAEEMNEIKEQFDNFQPIINDGVITDDQEENTFLLADRESEDIEQLQPLTTKIENLYHSNIHISDQFIASQLNEMFYAYETDYENYKSNTEWSIGGQFSPMIARRDVREKEAYLNAYNIADETELLAYSGGINVEIETDKRLSIQSGIYFSRMGQQINNIGVYSSYQNRYSTIENYQNSGIINTSSGQLQTEPGTNYYVDKSYQQDNNIDEPSSSDALDGNFEYRTNLDEEPIPGDPSNIINNRVSSAVVNYVEHDANIGYEAINESIDQTRQLNPSNTLNKTFEYIEVPIILKYKVIESKIDIHVLGGMSTNFLINNRLYYNTIDGKRNSIPEATDFSRFNYSSIVGLGFEYPIVSNLLLNFEPSFKYFINSINNDNYINSHPYSFAFFSGLSYKF